MVKKFLR